MFKVFVLLDAHPFFSASFSGRSSQSFLSVKTEKKLNYWNKHIFAMQYLLSTSTVEIKMKEIKNVNFKITAFI